MVDRQRECAESETNQKEHVSSFSFNFYQRFYRSGVQLCFINLVNFTWFGKIAVQLCFFHFKMVYPKVGLLQLPIVVKFLVFYMETSSLKIQVF